MHPQILQYISYMDPMATTQAPMYMHNISNIPGFMEYLGWLRGWQTAPKTTRITMKSYDTGWALTLRQANLFKLVLHRSKSDRTRSVGKDLGPGCGRGGGRLPEAIRGSEQVHHDHLGGISADSTWGKHVRLHYLHRTDVKG